MGHTSEEEFQSSLTCRLSSTYVCIQAYTAVLVTAARVNKCPSCKIRFGHTKDTVNRSEIQRGQPQVDEKAL